MENNAKKILKIAIIKPPIIGHLYRGTGVYTDNLYQALTKENEVNITYVNKGTKLYEFDLIHYPYFDPFFLTLPVFKDKPRVVTVHDLIPLIYPKFFPAGMTGYIKWQIQKMALVRSEAVITDSNTSKQDIVKISGLKKENIFVIPLGVRSEFKKVYSPKILDKIREKFSLPQDFILHVGDVNYNKNIPNLIRAFHRLVKNNSAINLVLVGNGFVSNSPQLEEIINLIKFFKLEKKIFRLRQIKLEELVAFYNLARIYLQPSLAEGFGLPVIEAMACGCPVIVSKIAPLIEVADEAAFYVDPYDFRSIARVIESLLKNKAISHSMAQKGLKRSELFTWAKTARQTISVYKKVLLKY